jgi:hypothetical protein
MRACRCACHSEKLGDLHDAMQRDDRGAVAYYSTDDHLEIPPMVDLQSQLESAIACTRCGPNHVPLKPPPPKYLPPRSWKPDADSTGNPED